MSGRNTASMMGPDIVPGIPYSIRNKEGTVYFINEKKVIMIVIKPNKKYSILVSILSIILFIYLDKFISENDTLRLFHILNITKNTSLVIIGIVVIFSIYWTVQAFVSKNHIVIDKIGIRLSFGKFIKWSEIEDVRLYKYEFIDIGASIRLTNGRKKLVKWMRLDCGVRRFIHILLYYKQNSEKREELGVSSILLH